MMHDETSWIKIHLQHLSITRYRRFFRIVCVIWLFKICLAIAQLLHLNIVKIVFGEPIPMLEDLPCHTTRMQLAVSLQCGIVGTVRCFLWAPPKIILIKINVLSDFYKYSHFLRQFTPMGPFIGNITKEPSFRQSIFTKSVPVKSAFTFCSKNEYLYLEIGWPFELSKKKIKLSFGTTLVSGKF